MPRRKRNYLPGMPDHLVQRGNDRRRCFTDRADFRFYLDLWRAKARWYGVNVHAFCLMSNHIHFIVSSPEPAAISCTMKVVGSRYACHFNKRHGRTGTLQEGRHRSSLIDSDTYLLTCYRYVESNPVRAGMVKTARDYEWSSHTMNTSGELDWLPPHEIYRALGRDDTSRAVAYTALFRTSPSESDIALIHQATHYSQPIGSESFRRTIERRFDLPTGYMARGRPNKSGNCGTGQFLIPPSPFIP